MYSNLKPEMSDNLKKSIMIESNERTGLTSIYGLRMITDDHLIELISYLIKMSQSKAVKLDSFILHNAKLSDAGISILLEYLEVHWNSLKTLKLYNNIMNIVESNREIPYLLKSTSLFASFLYQATQLETLELHGFFLHSEDLPSFCHALSKCYLLRKLHLSNNNLSDFGVSYLAKVLSLHNTIPLENITLYNNNIGDCGAQMIADALYGSDSLESLNLQMNFIKDLGASFFVDFVRKGAYPSVRKIVLAGNQCSERMKRFIKANTP